MVRPPTPVTLKSIKSTRTPSIEPSIEIARRWSRRFSFAPKLTLCFIASSVEMWLFRQFGGKRKSAAAELILFIRGADKRALDLGITYFDTADGYALRF